MPAALKAAPLARSHRPTGARRLFAPAGGRPQTPARAGPLGASLRRRFQVRFGSAGFPGLRRRGAAGAGGTANLAPPSCLASQVAKLAGEVAHALANEGQDARELCVERLRQRLVQLAPEMG